MIEAEVLRERVERDRAGLGRVIATARLALRGADVDGRYRVAPRIAPRIRVGEELLGERHLQARFLVRLPHRRVVQGFALVDEAAGQGPAEGWMRTADEHDAIARQLDDAVDGAQRRLDLCHAAELTS